MTQLLLIRAGATEYGSQGRIQGRLDVPLSEDGRRRIEQVAEELRGQPVAAIFCGPCRATQESAEIIAVLHDLKPKIVKDLCNLNYGLWQGSLISDVKSKQPKVYRLWQEHPESVCPPEGETLQAARDRLVQSIYKLGKKYKTGLIALVVPEPAASVLRHVLGHDELGNLWQTEVDELPPWEIFDLPAKVEQP